jgi:iron(III)-enterobactin esterase
VRRQQSASPSSTLGYAVRGGRARDDATGVLAAARDVPTGNATHGPRKFYWHEVRHRPVMSRAESGSAATSRRDSPRAARKGARAFAPDPDNMRDRLGSLGLLLIGWVACGCASDGADPGEAMSLADGGTSGSAAAAGGQSAAVGGALPVSSAGAGATPSSSGASNAGAPSGAGGAAAAGGPASSGGAASAGASANGGKSSSTDPGTAGDGEIDVGPSYTASPDGKLKAGAAAGFSVSFTLTSAQSSIFKGDDFTPPLTFSRQIKVFVPQQYVDGTESPFMVSSDGFYGGLQTVVQNLADDPSPDHRVPPLVIIGIQNGPDVHPNSERSLEYDTVSDRYFRFVTKEVIPAVLANGALKAKFPNFKLTSDPNGRGGYGCSSGGPAVMGLAWFGDFNRVFSFSGSLVALQKTTEHPDGAWEYPALITAAPLRPDLRVFLEVGENDNRYTEPESSHTNWVIANKNMAAALKAKGNHYRFVFAKGAGHCDNAARNQVMPEGLIWLWRGYTAK